MSEGSTVGQDWEGLPRSPPTSGRVDRYSDNSPPSASSPSPLGKGSGIGGNAFQHRIPRTALYRWPAAPLPRNAVAAKGGSWSSLSLSPRSGSRAVGSLLRGKCRRCLSGFACEVRHPLTTHRRPGGMKGKKIAHGTATGAAIKDTRCFIPRSISKCWALPSGLGKPNLIPCTGI
jgi:hypothetical protein